MNGKVRTDIIDVYVFRRTGLRDEIEFLQLMRAKPPLDGTWQPVMGHAESWETAAQCALRELEEETGLARENEMLKGLWALEQVHPFYLAAEDAVVMSPRFVAEVSAEWEPKLNDENQGVRWVPEADVGESFLWPGQRASVKEALSEVVPYTSNTRDHLRVDHTSVKR